MGLIEIEYGALASSATMNNNFNYLDDKISGVSEEIISISSTFNSKITSLNSIISNMNENVTSSISALNSKFEGLLENGLYINTYTNGNSWYREYFSDEEKTSRVWLVQGGKTNIGSTNGRVDVTLLKPFTNPVSVIATPEYTEYNSGGGVTYGTAAAYFIDNSTIKISVAATNSYGQYWVAYGN